MRKTDVENIVSIQKGVMENVSDDIIRYNEAKRRKIDEIHEKERINTLESKLNNIETLLQQLLQKAN